jgi:hypothetical protein
VPAPQALDLVTLGAQVSINDQIAELGAQLETAILDTYMAVSSGGLASLTGRPLLAFLPGDITVPVASFVQPVADGTPDDSSTTSTAGPASGQGQNVAPAEAVNPLLVTSWLKSDGVGADTPLLLQTNQSTVIGGPPGGFTTMSELYFDLAEFAQPVAVADSPDANRLDQLLVWAREALPSSPDLLPLLTQPSTWPLPNATGWNQFSFTSTPAPSSPTAGGQGAPSSSASPASPSSPWLQGLRFMPGRVLRISPVQESGPPSAEPGPERPAGAGTVSVIRPVASDPAGSGRVAGNSAAAVMTMPSLAQTPAIPATNSTVMAPRPVIPIFLAGLSATSAEPGTGGNAVSPVQAAATQITLEHMLVSIDRSSWWHNDWLVDPGWYVPGMPSGSSIGPSPDPGQVWGLPIALILVKNLTMTGFWSSADAAQLTSDGTLLGPFNLGGATAAANADNSVSITVPGPSVAALFCQPLAILPPANPPVTTPASQS